MKVLLRKISECPHFMQGMCKYFPELTGPQFKNQFVPLKAHMRACSLLTLVPQCPSLLL